MNPILYISGHELGTRAVLVVLALFVVLQDVALGMPTWFDEDTWFRQLLSNEGSFQPATTRLRRLQQLTRIVKRNAAMSTIQGDYEEFYNELSSFVKDIPSHVKSDTPSVLSSNIDAVTHIISPSDEAFVLQDAEQVIKRVMLTVQITTAYLSKVETCGFIKDESMNWFTGQKKSLVLLSSLVRLSLGSLSFQNVDVLVGDAGIGGINTGTFHGLGSDVVSKLRALIIALRAEC